MAEVEESIAALSNDGNLANVGVATTVQAIDWEECGVDRDQVREAVEVAFSAQLRQRAFGSGQPVSRLPKLRVEDFDLRFTDRSRTWRRTFDNVAHTNTNTNN